MAESSRAALQPVVAVEVAQLEMGYVSVAAPVPDVVELHQESAAVDRMVERVASRPVLVRGVVLVDTVGVAVVEAADAAVDRIAVLVVDGYSFVHVADHVHIGRKNWLARSSNLHNKDNAWLLLSVSLELHSLVHALLYTYMYDFRHRACHNKMCIPILTVGVPVVYTLNIT